MTRATLLERSSDSVRFRIDTTGDALVSVVDITLHPASDRGERPVTRRVGMPQRTLPVLATSVAFLETAPPACACRRRRSGSDIRDEDTQDRRDLARRRMALQASPALTSPAGGIH